MNRELINKTALESYGIDSQVRQYGEEMSELFVALNRMCRKRPDVDVDDIAEEIADVSIMLEQMSLFFGVSDKVDTIKKYKYKRLAKRLGIKED